MAVTLFDGTAANTRRRHDTCVMLKQKLGDLLHLACWYHAMELLVTAACETTMSGSPGEVLLLTNEKLGGGGIH